MPGVLLSSLARSAVFAPLEFGGRVDAVVERLSDSITLGMLREGEQLPTQQDLAAGLGVSVVTLRDAFAQLQQRGLVETRRGHGGGSFVKLNATISDARTRRRLHRMSSHDLIDLADMQRAVSSQASRLAAVRSTGEFVGRLTAHIDHLEQSTAIPERMVVDGRFLIEVAAASQSMRLTRTEMKLQAEVIDLRWLVSLDGEDDGNAQAAHHRAIVTSHRSLAAAIGEGDDARAQSIAEARIDLELRRLLDLHMRMWSA
jgi:GntR family transcriptional regulator, transcriptional repressor for pyruvate dehydrogenase complex